MFCRVRTNHTRGIYPGYYPTNNFCKICRVLIPVTGTSGSSGRRSYLYSTELLEVLYARGTIPGVRVQHVLYPLGTSVSSVRLCHNTRNFWKFRKTSVPVQWTSGGSVRSSYPYPEILWLLWDCGTIPEYGYTFVTIPGEFCIHLGLIREVYYYKKKNTIQLWDRIFCRNSSLQAVFDTPIARITGCVSSLRI